MAKLMILVALCVLLPALVSATAIVDESYNGFVVVGRVYCDTCRAGFETNVTDYTSLKGSEVKLECVNSATLQVVYQNFGYADENGYYSIAVNYDHKEEICSVILLKSTNSNCAEPCSGRGKATVIVTRNNGLISKYRNANLMGFLIITPLPGCTELIKSYFIE